MNISANSPTGVKSHRMTLATASAAPRPADVDHYTLVPQIGSFLNVKQDLVDLVRQVAAVRRFLGAMLRENPPKNRSGRSARTRIAVAPAAHRLVGALLPETSSHWVTHRCTASMLSFTDSARDAPASEARSGPVSR
jgi:hypothetical protein